MFVLDLLKTLTEPAFQWSKAYDGIQVSESFGVRWERLTRPLKPTPEQLAEEKEIRERGERIALANQDVAEYNWRNYWTEVEYLKTHEQTTETK